MPRVKKSESEKLITCDRCRTCVYHLFCDQSIILCGYMYYTNKRRPCEADKNCTVYMPIEGNEKYRKQLLIKPKYDY